MFANTYKLSTPISFEYNSLYYPLRLVLFDVSEMGTCYACEIVLYQYYRITHNGINRPECLKNEEGGK